MAMLRSILGGGLALLAMSSPAAGQALCDLTGYVPRAGLTATAEGDLLAVGWAGEAGAELRLRFAIVGVQPVIRDLAIRRAAGPWATLAQDLSPYFHVTTGVRRMSTQQVAPFNERGVAITPEIIEREKWWAFWDAPLLVPGTQEGQKTPRNLDLPRKAEEIRQATASFTTKSCSVRTDGGRLEVRFPGLSMGTFTGSLRFTVYRGTSLVRMEAVAKTEEPSVAYKYDAGLTGFSTDLTPRVTWQDTGGNPQQHQFGGPRSDTLVPVRAKQRILIVEGPRGSVATFPPPHKFFFAREVETNLGYVWYRKDDDRRFGVGVRQGDREEVQEYVQNFALYNAPPETWQRMAVYFYASPGPSASARQSVLAFTHGDAYKALPGYQTLVNHFHVSFTEQLRAAGSLDSQVEDLVAMRALGVNIVGLSDFHDDLRPFDQGAGRFEDQRDYALGCAKASDKDFLVLPWQEIYQFGGHNDILFSKPVYFTTSASQYKSDQLQLLPRPPGQPFTETDPVYGKVYHVGSPEDLQQMLEAEDAYWVFPHPRTKGSAGYPDAIVDKPWVRHDRFLGVDFKQGPGTDLSDPRLCEWRCFGSVDTMNNLFAGSGLRPKYLLANIDTYRKGPGDELYANFAVSYLKLPELPRPSDDWSPILKVLRDGNFFVTTGEILIRNYAIEGTGNSRTIAADLEWTFPLEFVEVVWGDGKKVDRQIIPATDLPPFGTKRLVIPFDAAGKVWVRFAAWDSAGNGAFVQPMWLRAGARGTSAGGDVPRPRF